MRERLIYILSVVIVIIALAACARSDGPRASELAPQTASSSTPRGTLPPSNSPTRYVGVWAAAETACGHAAWRFERDKLQSPGWTACEFKDVARDEDGFAIAAHCSDGATERDATLRLSFAEAAQAMLMQGAPDTGDVGLIYCGPLEG